MTHDDIIDTFKKLQDVLQSQKELNEVIIKRLNLLEKQNKANTELKLQAIMGQILYHTALIAPSLQDADPWSIVQCRLYSLPWLHTQWIWDQCRKSDPGTYTDLWSIRKLAGDETCRMDLGSVACGNSTLFLEELRRNRD